MEIDIDCVSTELIETVHFLRTENAKLKKQVAECKRVVKEKNGRIQELKETCKRTLGRKEYYKHGYCAEQERAERLEKALDKACEVMTSRVNIDRGDGYPTLNFTKEEWKEWCLQDD